MLSFKEGEIDSSATQGTLFLITARSISTLTRVPDSAALFFNRSKRRSSNLIVVCMMQNHTSLTSLIKRPIIGTVFVNSRLAG